MFDVVVLVFSHSPNAYLKWVPVCVKCIQIFLLSVVTGHLVYILKLDCKIVNHKESIVYRYL